MLPSPETRERLGISCCHLMHLRESGKLRFEKRGNAFFYSKEDVENLTKSFSSRRCLRFPGIRNHPFND